MTEDAGVQIALGALTISGGIIAWTIRQAHSVAKTAAENAERMARLELKMEILWEDAHRGGILESVERKAGKVKSPMQITEIGVDMMKPVLPELLLWYRGKEQLDEETFEEVLAHDWNKRFFEDICLPLGLKNVMTCVRLAISILRPSSQVGTTKAGDTDPDLKPPVT